MVYGKWISLMLVGLLFPGTTVSLKSDKVLENIPVVAHRGASKAAPENTLPAFEKAWLQGADAIEGDFHLTADNEIVCVHDANIRHYTQKDIEVRDLTLAELKKLDFGRWHDKQFAGTRIPTFKEVVATIPKGKRIFIEIKSDAQLVPHLIHQIRNSSLELQQIVIISFHKDVIKAVEDKWPELKTFWLTRFKTNERGQLDPAPTTVLRTLETLGTDGLSTHFEGLTSELVKSFQKAGYEYHVWTVDEIPRAKGLIEMGVQSITTNVPGEILKAIRGSSE
ncbi:MAG: glycerophosphodiester phosphodiesterase [Planctomycetaceae bacterium]|jgi:glycerophosphoryl diester phosphodiesterase|nr:glycerophosphodiester phosphodiesterase [Planctomycetaceae bacterium]